MNLTAAGLLGVDRNFFRGTPFHLVVVDEFKRTFWDHQARVLASSKKETCDVQLVRKNGTQFYAHLEWIRVDDGGSMIYCVLTDITERKLIEDELAQSRSDLEIRVQERTGELSEAYETLQRETEEREKIEDQLRQSHKMEAIGTLSGGIAHDFNNILAAILGFTEMAIEDTEGQPNVQKSLDNILKSAIRGRDLVKQILTFSRKMSYAQTPVSVTPILHETINMLRASIPATVAIKFSSSARSDTIIASSTEVQQVIMNLSTNAFKAMEENGGTLEIALSDTFHSYSADKETPPADFLQLVIKDNGVGMTPEVLQKAFDPFFTTREPGKGTGMGLSVVYGIVRNLNGTITALSTPGKGSTFRIFIPKARTEPAREVETLADIQGGKETILFVEDEELINEWGTTTLEKLGYTVMAFDNPREALQAFFLYHKSFDLVITDQSMPTMTGTQLVSKILSLRADIPIIMCTGHPELLSADNMTDSGISEVVLKPLTKREFASAVRRVIDVKRAA